MPMEKRQLFQLNARLQAAAAMVRQGAKVADIGTDHAYLPIWLVKSGRCPCAVAADLRSGPLERAKQNIARYGVEDKVFLRLCDGLAGILPEEAEDIVICGMGGELIARILDSAPWVRYPGKKLILQPMTSAEDLRQYLRAQQFFVCQEIAVEDAGRVYSVMEVVGENKEEEYPPEFDYLGKLNVSASPEALRYAQRQVRHLLNLRAGQLARGKTEEALGTEEILSHIAEKMGVALSQMLHEK